MSDVEETLREFTAARKVLEVRLDEGDNILAVVRLVPVIALDKKGDPGVWGIILCDTLNHIARAYDALVEGVPTLEVAKEAVIGRIVGVMLQELQLEDHTSGQTVAVDGKPLGEVPDPRLTALEALRVLFGHRLEPGDTITLDNEEASGRIGFSLWDSDSEQKTSGVTPARFDRAAQDG